MGNIIICAPSRIYEDHPGGRFSYAAMAEYFSSVGLTAVDMSFETLSRFDDSWRAVLYAAAKRKKEKNNTIPLCHLSFYMPDPKDALLMARYSRELMRGVDAASLMGIPLAVVHPIAWYSSEVKYGDWVRANMAFLTPIVKYAEEKGVRICIENMPSAKERPDNHLYGSCALNISSLASKLGAGICWDVGHANISGYKQSEQMQILDGKLDVLHVHDNDGKTDSHSVPFTGTVDWEDVAFGMRCCRFEGILDVEVSAWALDGGRGARETLGAEIVSCARRIVALAAK